MEDWVTIKNLRNGKTKHSIRGIARLMGISKNTVKSALKREGPPKYIRKPTINPDIEPFVETIAKKFFVDNLVKSRVLEDIKEDGYKGSKSAFYRYCTKHIRKDKRTFRPYETGPGEQAQFDWSPYMVSIAGRQTNVFVFSYILGNSRYRIYEASLSDKQGCVFEALESSMIETGGVCQRVQVDNAACFVPPRSKNGNIWNKRYLAFCGHYGYKPSRSKPKRPWSKGKVEKPFSYLENHFIAGNAFESFEDFAEKLKRFQDKVNNRVHDTTHQTPVSLFEEERGHLAALPQNRYVDVQEEVRKVTQDCLISYNGSRYSVPYVFAGNNVWVKVSKGYYLSVYSSQNKLIATHKLSLEKGKVVIENEHYKGHRVERGNWSRMAATFIEMFPGQRWLPDALKQQKRINQNYHLARVLELSKYYRRQDMIRSFETCSEYNIYSYIFIRSFLENNSSPFDLPPVKVEPGPGIQSHYIISSLKNYSSLFELSPVKVEPGPGDCYRQSDIHRPLSYYQEGGPDNE